MTAAAEGTIGFEVATVPVTAAALACMGNAVTIVGTEGNDVLVGTNGPDVIHVVAGNNIVLGRGGDDIICGGPGTDSCVNGLAIRC